MAGADAYLEAGFTGGTLAAGPSTGELQVRMSKSDWSDFDEAGDASRSTATAYTDAPRIPAHLGTALAWGTPPT